MTHSCDSITSPCIKHLAIQVIRTKVTTGDCQLSSIATKTVSMHHNTVNTSHIGGLVSIHAPLAGRDITEHTAAQEHSVSIHAPLVGRDVEFRFNFAENTVSIHAPLAEHDLETERRRFPRFVSIHVPLAEHDGQSVLCDHATGVSIHVPLAEHDCNHRQF